MLYCWILILSKWTVVSARQVWKINAVRQKKKKGKLFVKPDPPFYSWLVFRDHFASHFKWGMLSMWVPV